MLKLLQLEGFATRAVTQLSGGQRQRVALGRALAVDPQILLLDEPMSNLDYKVRLELRHELRALQRRIGITAVYVTHDREEALTLADRIAVIDGGRIVQVGTPQDIYHRPQSAFVAGFMGADNALDVTRLSDGSIVLAAPGVPAAARVRAHFRSDAAQLLSADTAHPSDVLHVRGVVAQSVYVGEGFRYRVRADGTDVWIHARQHIAEGTAAVVAVPLDALMLFAGDTVSQNASPQISSSQVSSSQISSSQVSSPQISSSQHQ
jgi:ABC-type Fe3+/spermidine/putrescine transport system ATPase subunit